MIHPLNPLQQHLSCRGVTSFCILFIGDIFKSNFKRQKDCTREFQAEVEQQTLNQSVKKTKQRQHITQPTEAIQEDSNTWQQL